VHGFRLGFSFWLFITSGSVCSLTALSFSLAYRECVLLERIYSLWADDVVCVDVCLQKGSGNYVWRYETGLARVYLLFAPHRVAFRFDHITFWLVDKRLALFLRVTVNWSCCCFHPVLERHMRFMSRLVQTEGAATVCRCTFHALCAVCCVFAVIVSVCLVVILVVKLLRLGNFPLSQIPRTPILVRAAACL
jgi:hypothetical protein